ncbi:hypothetical protein B0H11DRAFT_923609 [Mycena galericulata]|nr:hypothetical protein B0H11DRAFT_923609 [Mycena galericulata]
MHTNHGQRYFQRHPGNYNIYQDEFQASDEMQGGFANEQDHHDFDDAREFRDEARPYRPINAPHRANQYGALGLGRPPVHGRLPSFNLTPSLPPAGRRSRSAQSPDFSGMSGAATGGQPGDIDALFQQLSLRQEEHHRERMRQMEAENTELKARLTSLEARSQVASSESSRGGLSGRGGTRRKGKVRALRTLQRGVSADNAVQPVESPEQRVRGSTASSERLSDDEADDERGDEENTLKPDAKTQKVIQKCSTQVFRIACGVKGKDWPGPNVPRSNPTTGTEYLSPFFDRDVTDPRNHAVCVAVSSQLGEELKLHRPPDLPKDAVWTAAMLLTCAKNSFRACKMSWRKVNDNKAAQKSAINEQSNRRASRRVTKYKHVASQVEAYATAHNIPPSVANELLTEELLSEEVSGPEDGESFDAWKVRMAAAHGLKDLTPNALADEHFWEVLECPWRSDQLADVSHEMQTLFNNTLVTTKSGNILFKRVPTPTHRQSQRIPLISPWNFGIDVKWLEEQRKNPKVAPLLEDWGSHGDPEGFVPHALTQPTTTEGPAGVQAVDPRFDFRSLDASD